MENPENQSGEPTGAVEDPPPPISSAQEQSTSESSSQPQQEQQRRPPPPLSPLTGSYLLIVVGEPHSERHKEIILQKIAKAFLSWDVAECHVSLEKELQIITAQSPEGEEARYGERLIQYATENLVTEILIHPQLNTLHQCLKNLLSSFTKHRHIIHAGYTFAGNGSWILQDGTLSISDLIEALHEPDVLRVLKAYENSVSIDVHCAPEGEWTTERFQKEPVTKLCNVRINPGDVMTAGNPAISAFIDYLSPFLEPANIQHLLQPTDVVGNIRFTHPTLYVFPGGQGDAALFGINGFNMLIDGGFARKACFWDFARHLDRLDAVLLTRLNNSTVNGISAVLQRKKMNHVYPQIGHFFCNLQDRKIALSPDGDKDKDSLIVNLAEEGQEIVANLRHLALKPHPCYRDGNQVDPVNLYHKVGHGKLDMYVISPARDSQAVKEFLSKWSSNDSHLFSNTGKKAPGKAFEFPLQNLVSICALLVWQPANPNDTITRILFPGSTPQHKIFEGLEKLRHLEFLKHPVCSAKSISPSVSTVTVTRSLSKTRQPKPADNKQKETKIISKPQVKPTKPKIEKTPPKEIKSKLDNKLAEEKNEAENIEEPLKKLNNRILSKDEQIENIKKEIQKIEQAENEEQKKKIVHRSKYDMKNVKSKVDSRAPSKSADRKKLAEKKAEGEASPPGTPKKALQNGAATKAEKAKVGAKPGKATSPTSTPAKSAKEANNRKVVESRVTTRLTTKPVPKKKEETPPPLPPAVAKTERKPISRRPKASLSPVKSSVGKSKPDTEAISKRITKKIDTDTTVVKAIGQTISKGLVKDAAETEKTDIREGVEGKVEIIKLEAEMTENKETETKAVKEELQSAQLEVRNKEEEDEEEEEEEEEYLIITKEEYGEDSAKEDESGKENEEEVQTKDETEGEGEMKKLLREEEESEKKRENQEQVELPKEDEEEKDGEEKKETEEEQREAEVKIAEGRDDEGGRRAESPGEKSPEGRESELQRLMEVDEGIDLKEPASKEHREGESLPEEKMSNTLETSATTAPTLPEDERIEEPVDHAGEEEKDQGEDVKEVIEEKYIQEKTKEEKQEEEEKVEPVQPHVPTTIDVEGPSLPVQIAQKKHPRDVVKTPDEVAELPVHEEVDPRMYSSGDYSKELQRKPEEEKPDKPDFKATIKGEAKILDEEEEAETDDLKKVHEEKVDDPVITKYLNIIDELERSSTEPKKELKSLDADENVQHVVEDTKAEKPEEQKEKGDDLRRESVPQAGEPDLKSDLKESSERASPQEKPVSGKSTPQEKPLSGKSTPQEKDTEHLGTATPVDATKEEHLSGKTSPQDVEKFISEKRESLGQEKEISGKTTPVEVDKKQSIESLPQDTQKEILEKSSPLPPEDVSRGPSPQKLEKQISGKSSPAGENGEQFKSSPQPQEVEIPQEEQKETSRKSSIKDLEKDMKGQSSGLELSKEISGKSTPEEDIVQKMNGSALAKDSVPSPVPDLPEKEEESAIAPSQLVENGVEKFSEETEKYLSGKSTPVDVEKNVLKESKIEDLVKDASGKSTPLELVRDISGKSTPQELVQEQSGKSTPHELSKDISGKSTPLEVAQSISGKSTPQDLTKEISEKRGSREIIKDISGKITPQELVREPSGKSTPQDLIKEVSGKSTPQEKDVSGKSTPHDLAREPSGKSTPQELCKDISGKSTPCDLGKEIFEKSPPQDFDKEVSGKSTPHDLGKEISGQSTPQDLVKEVSGKSTPQDLVKEVSGKSTPQDLVKEVSGKATPQDLVKDVSGKSTPQDLTKEISGKSTPQDLVKEVSGKSTPHDLVKEVSGKSTPHDLGKEISGQSTPQDLVKEVSGKSTPEELVKETPGKSTPQDLVKEVSGKSTPQDLVKDVSGKSTPQDLTKEISGKLTPQDLKEISGKSSPQEPLKEVSGKSSPQELGTEIKEETTGKLTPQEIIKEPSGKSTPQDLIKEVSGKSTPQDLTKEVSGKSTPQDITKEISGKSTPLDLAKEVSGKSTPQDLTREISGKSTPQELHPELPTESSPPDDSREKTTQQEQQQIVSDKESPQNLSKNASQRSSLQESEILTQKSQLQISGKTTPEDSGKVISEKTTHGQVDILSEKESPRPTETELQEISSENILDVEKPVSGKTTPVEGVSSGKSSRRGSVLVDSNRTSPAQVSPQPDADLGIASKDGSVEPEKSQEKGTEQKVKEEERSDSRGIDKPLSGRVTPEDKAAPVKDVSEKPDEKPVGKKVVESSVSESVSSGQGEKDASGKSTPFSTDREISGKASPTVGGKVTSDSVSLALAEKGTSGTCSLEKQSSEKISSPSPVDISPLSLDELREGNKEKDEMTARSPVERRSVTDSHMKSQLDRIRYEEGASSGTSTPDRSHYEKSDASVPNGIESDDEPEKGILESERQEKESQILDISSGEEEELKALGDDEDSDAELKKDELEGDIGHAKGEKDDINQLVKIGGGIETEEQDSDSKTGVKRMLVTASSEDGGTETEICIKSGVKIIKDELSDEEEKKDEKKEESEEGDFSNLILQAREEYNTQRLRKTSYNSSEDVEEAEEAGTGEEEEELGSLLQQARQELAFVRQKNREMLENTSVTPERMYETRKTTTTSETTGMDDDQDIITITTILTEEREEQEDGSIKVTTTKETTTKGGKNEGTVTTVSTNIEKKDDKKTDDEESSSQVNSSGEQRGGKRSSKEDGEGKVSQEEAMETSRRTSASSIISQEDLVSRKDSAKIEDFRQSSTEMSPLKTTYITSCGDSESLMTSSFYGNLPTEDEMIGRAEHLREFRKGRGYESFTEVGPNGERTERTYFYGGEDDPRGGRSRIVKAYYTEESQQQKEGEPTRFVHRMYPSDIPEEETEEKTHFVQRFYTEETSQSETNGKFRFVSETQEEHVDFARAVDEHMSVRGEYLGKEPGEDVAKYTNGKTKEEEESEGGSKPDADKEKDVIEGWGKPLGLPLPPKNTYKTCSFPGQNISTTSTLSTPTDNSDSVNNWGHPMNLPSPAPPPTANGTVDAGKTSKETPKKERKVPPKKNISGDRSSGTNTPNRRSESPVKQMERRTPSTGRSNKSASSSFVYLDLTYVPHHGNSYYSNVEFFKKVRARYYVFSGTEPSKEVYNALLEAKQTWEDKKLEVTIIPTYDTDVLGYWVAENEEILAQHKIDLSPSASRCTINLQDHETSCSAYRLEF